MILVDMNQVTISNLMMQIKHNDLSVDLVRHLVLNSIRSYRTKFSNDYGELIPVSYTHLTLPTRS